MKVTRFTRYHLIGAVLLVHWVLLAVDRTASGIWYNMLWTSHLALLLAAVGFLSQRNLIISAALVSIIVGHGLWLSEFFAYLLTGTVPLGYYPHIWELSIVKAILTSHHLYLIPLLAYTLWKQKQVDSRAWMVAAGILLISTTLAFFTPPEANVNCAHAVCGPLLKILPFLSVIDLPFWIYTPLAVVITTIVAFWLPNLLLRRLSGSP